MIKRPTFLSKEGKLISSANKFVKGGGLAKYAQGGGTPTFLPTLVPTRQDSLALYNNALEKIKFYKGNPDYRMQAKTPGYTDFKKADTRKKLIKEANQMSQRGITDDVIKELINNTIRTGKPLTDDQKSKLRQQLNKRTFGKVRNTNLTSFGDILVGKADTYFNPLAPPIYLHPNITPQGYEGYSSKRFGDISEIPFYDPIAIAPFDILNPKQQKERLKKYGTTGTPFDKSVVTKVIEQPKDKNPVEVQKKIEQPRDEYGESEDWRKREKDPLTYSYLDWNTYNPEMNSWIDELKTPRKLEKYNVNLPLNQQSKDFQNYLIIANRQARQAGLYDQQTWANDDILNVDDPIIKKHLDEYKQYSSGDSEYCSSCAKIHWTPKRSKFTPDTAPSKQSQEVTFSPAAGQDYKSWSNRDGYVDKVSEKDPWLRELFDEKGEKVGYWQSNNMGIPDIQLRHLVLPKKQIGGGAHLNYITNDQTHYDHLTNDININKEDKIPVDNAIAHEFWHHYQNMNGWNRLPEDFPTMKRPQTPSSDEANAKYFNRRIDDNNILIKDFKNRYPEFNMVPDDLISHRETLNQMYQQPWTLEGEARAVETPEGREWLSREGIYDLDEYEDLLKTFKFEHKETLDKYQYLNSEVSSGDPKTKKRFLPLLQSVMDDRASNVSNSKAKIPASLINPAYNNIKVAPTKQATISQTSPDYRSAIAKKEEMQRGLENENLILNKQTGQYQKSLVENTPANQMKVLLGAAAAPFIAEGALLNAGRLASSGIGPAIGTALETSPSWAPGLSINNAFGVLGMSNIANKGLLSDEYAKNINNAKGAWETTKAVGEPIFDVFNAGNLATKMGPAFYNAAQNLGKYLTEETALQNASKLNSKAFKENPDAYYRGIGEVGYKDAIESGVLRVNQNPKWIGAGPPELQSPYFFSGKNFEGIKQYEPNVIVEVTNQPMRARTFSRLAGSGDNSVYQPIRNTGQKFAGKDVVEKLPNIPLGENTKFYKKHWWQGYKQVEVPKQLPGSPNVNKVDAADYMSLEAPKGNIYGENQVQVQQSRLLNPEIKAKFFEHQAPQVDPVIETNFFTRSKLWKAPRDHGNRITPENYEDFVKNIHGSTDYGIAEGTGYQPSNLGVGTYGKPGMVFSDAPLNNLGKDIVNAHEKNHGMFARTLSKEMGQDLLKPFGTKKPLSGYGASEQEDEVLARMGQFKNAIGMGDNQTFTLGHLNLIRKNYAKSFLDNGITEMLTKIKPGSLGEKEFLKNMNTYAYGIGAVATLGTAGTLQQKKRGGSVSELGYKNNSPYKNQPYLDINTPNGGITMKNVDKVLFAVDNTGQEKIMYPGQEYKFSGNKVREIPIAQKGNGQLTDEQIVDAYMKKEKEDAIIAENTNQRIKNIPTVTTYSGSTPNDLVKNVVKKTVVPSKNKTTIDTLPNIPIKNLKINQNDAESTGYKTNNYRPDPMSVEGKSLYSYTNDPEIDSGPWFDFKNKVSRAIDKYNPFDAEEADDVSELPTSVIKKIPSVKNKAVGYNDFGFTKLGVKADQNKGDSLLKYRNGWNNDSGTIVKIGHDIMEAKEKGNKKSFDNVEGVAHFIRNGDIIPSTNPEHNKNYHSEHGSNIKSTSTGKFLSSPKNDTDPYVMLYKSLGNDKFRIKYKKHNELTEKDKTDYPDGYDAKNKRFDLNIKSYPFSEIDWEGEGKSTGWLAKSNFVPLKKGHTSKNTQTYLPYKNKDAYSRFSGTSVIFLFKDPASGRNISEDFSGTINEIKNRGNELVKKYGIDSSKLDVAHHDTGSYSGKPLAKNKKLHYNQWADFNTIDRGKSGAPIMIIANDKAVPTKKTGGVVRNKNVNKIPYLSHSGKLINIK